MGDFWPGNVLVSLDENSRVKTISVIDWELAKTGLPGHDLGQFCAELYLLRSFDPISGEFALATSDMTSSFLKAYSRFKDIPLAQYVITHMGAHLVAWTPRIPWGSNQRTRQVVKEGVKYVVEPWVESDDKKLGEWFSHTSISVLATNR